MKEKQRPCTMSTYRKHTGELLDEMGPRVRVVLIDCLACQEHNLTRTLFFGAQTFSVDHQERERLQAVHRGWEGIP